MQVPSSERHLTRSRDRSSAVPAKARVSSSSAPTRSSSATGAMLNNPLRTWTCAQQEAMSPSTRRRHDTPDDERLLRLVGRDRL